jgi:hypothetical protein
VAVYTINRIEDYLEESIQAVFTQFTVPESTWLYLNLNDLHITDSPHSEKALQILPFVSQAGKRRMTVLEIITQLESAAMDPRVQGLILAFNDSVIEHRAILSGEMIESHLGMGVLNEIREAIIKFKFVKKNERHSMTMGSSNATGNQGAMSDNLGESESKSVLMDIMSLVAPNDAATTTDGDSKETTDGGVLWDTDKDVVIAIADNYCNPPLVSLTSSRI